MTQGVTGGLIVAAQQVHEEHVFPGASTHRTRLNFGQADVPQCEHAERLEERSRQIPDAESEGRFAGASRGAQRAAVNEKETREIFLVVLDSGLQNFSSIYVCSSSACGP